MRGIIYILLAFASNECVYRAELAILLRTGISSYGLITLYVMLFILAPITIFFSHFITFTIIMTSI